MELKSRKANTLVIPVASWKLHSIKTTISKRVPVDREERCEGQACRRRGKVSWVLNTQEFDEEEEDLVEIKFFICSAYNDKHKKKFDMCTIINRAPYVIETRMVSKEIISWMSNKLVTLLDVLPAVME